MATKITIEIYKEKKPEEFTTCLADPESKMQSGSAAANTAASAAAIAERVSKTLSSDGSNDERLDYLVRNTEIIRKYMVHLIDEDVKSRAPLRRAIREGGEHEIEAALQTSSAINNEIINMMCNFMPLLEEIAGLCDLTKIYLVKQAAVLAQAAAIVCQEDNLAIAGRSEDETYSYVLKREDEIMMQALNEAVDRIMGTMK